MKDEARIFYPSVTVVGTDREYVKFDTKVHETDRLMKHYLDNGQKIIVIYPTKKSDISTMDERPEQNVDKIGTTIDIKTDDRQVYYVNLQCMDREDGLQSYSSVMIMLENFACAVKHVFRYFSKEYRKSKDAVDIDDSTLLKDFSAMFIVGKFSPTIGRLLASRLQAVCIEHGMQITQNIIAEVGGCFSEDNVFNLAFDLGRDKKKENKKKKGKK